MESKSSSKLLARGLLLVVKNNIAGANSNMLEQVRNLQRLPLFIIILCTACGDRSAPRIHVKGGLPTCHEFEYNEVVLEK